VIFFCKPSDGLTDMHLVIQGTVDVPGKLTQDEISKTVDFCFQAFNPAVPGEREALIKKLQDLDVADLNSTNPKIKELEANMSADELRILNAVRAHRMVRPEDILNLSNFGTDTINGMRPRLQRGALTLVKAKVRTKGKREQIAVPTSAHILVQLPQKERRRERL
jgi:hypothetical protein